MDKMYILVGTCMLLRKICVEKKIKLTYHPYTIHKGSRQILLSRFFSAKGASPIIPPQWKTTEDQKNPLSSI